jgi:hypothetical protein
VWLGEHKNMTTAANDLETIIANCIAELKKAPIEGEAPVNTAGMRERFFELMVLILGNLYGKTPVAAPLFDRNTLLRVTKDMDDGDSGRLAGRTEDWLRLESLLRQQDGQKAYFLTLPTLSALSTMTSAGTLGEVLEKILKHYATSAATPELRNAVCILGSQILTRLARN